MISLEELALCAQNGDKASLETLISYFKPYITKQAHLTYVKGYDMEDLIQIGYVSLLKAIRVYKPYNKNFNYYALASVKRNFYYLIRPEARHNAEYSMEFETSDGLTLGDGIEDKFNLEEDCIKKEARQQLKESLKSLNKDERELINWVYFQKKNLKEYAKINGITYNQGRYRLKRALNKLRVSWTASDQ
ncbi:RNA polymerase sigma factor (sigma-70 family) [Clostridium pascui]|uniref:sigma-70 family RNA polymerase sigma factor n=1 Tax=Clostridium pascui TaxID=46609 RepID=UPI00195C3908|nr:sigma-70 family RNA polymerase sigma factor [Clostridium pascui]MBM7868552.1 RNA polymerase sigma factor (sigma-70 family) [Clostridium pascui]